MPAFGRPHLDEVASKMLSISMDRTMKLRRPVSRHNGPLILHLRGRPGTDKTAMALALADQVGVPLVPVRLSGLGSLDGLFERLEAFLQRVAHA